MSVVTLESLISSWAYKRKPELKLLSSFSKGLGIVLLVYFAMKVTDLYARGATVWVLDKAHFFFLPGTVRHRGPAGHPAHLLGGAQFD